MKTFEAFQRLSSIHLHASLVLITTCYVRTALMLPPIGNCRATCPTDINPVCGSNSVTYSNTCNMRAAGCNLGIIIRETHTGHCDRVGGNRCSGFCDASYNPVCGNNLMTYSNRCELKHASCVYNLHLTVLSEGMCRRGLVKSAVTGPLLVDTRHHTIRTFQGRIPDSFNDTRPLMRGRITGRLWVRPTPSSSGCSKCPKTWDPVCGTDGNTYNNTCLLFCASDKTLKVAYRGACVRGEFGVCPAWCSLAWDPVCGTDRKTYSNDCFLGLEVCTTGKNITVSHRGECEDRIRCPDATCPEGTMCEHRSKCVCVHVCVKMRHPFCGSDGKTYGNVCELYRAKCKGKTDLKAICKGRCHKDKKSGNLTCKKHED